MPELKITKIYNQQELIGYGGNQDWFLDSWPQKAGCASVLGSNMYAYYMNIEKTQKDDFLSIMNDLYSYMTPGKMGFPFFYEFAHQMVKRMEKENVHLTPTYLKKSKSVDMSIQFVKKSIDECHPVGVLILSHVAKELEEDNWHWICISGYEIIEDKTIIIFSDCGVRREIDADILFDVHPRNIVKLVRFESRKENL